MSETMIGCEEALRRLAEHLDGELDRQVHAAVAEHLARCRSCWSRAEFERRLKAQLGQLGERGIEPDFESRIRSLIHRFADAPGAAPPID